ncbi:hypothetical protein D9M71_708610 [compost metagenome]
MPVSIAADDHRPDRAHQETDAKGGQRHQQRRHGRVRGEEVLADQYSEEAVDREVVHFQRIAQRAGDQGFTGGRYLRG